MSKDLAEFIELSQAFSSADQVQGGGGNSSLKINDKEMLIKASGYELAEVSMESGYTSVDHIRISNFIRNEELSLNSDTNYNDCLQASNQGRLRPSMETGFHAILDRCVIHSHSVYANILNCSSQGQELIRTKIYDLNGKPALLVPYTNPGFSVSKTIYQHLQLYIEKQGCKPQLIFLANHGLIISATELELVFKLEAKLKTQINENLSLSAFPQIKKTRSPEELITKVLFPDQSIYISRTKLDTSGEIISKNPKEKRAIEQTITAYNYILDNILSMGWQPIYIEDNKIDQLNNMESEKYRQGIIQS
jgi:rhamnose utilization protein RhaD (predicted bifunctional aldolase and dehydrogenase)